MVFGVPGRTGLSVPRHVVEERLRGEDSVTALYHQMVVNSVRAMLPRVEIVEKDNVSKFSVIEPPSWGCLMFFIPFFNIWKCLICR